MGQAMLFGFLGGLGLFIYGMRAMGDGLQKAAGDRMRRLLETLTRNPVLGLLVGAVVTAVIQSSSATTVMVVGFVNAGLMTLSQAVGVIMGANIGTTVTAQLIAFKLTDYALPALGMGVALNLFGRRKSQRDWGQVVVGFGLLFLGMETMGNAMLPLRDMPQFANLTIMYSQHSVLGVLTGFFMTALVQSSSATIGILQAMAGEGLITIQVALPILFGDNIGTCITALLSSIGASLTARRAAMLHLTIKAVGAVIFILLMPFMVYLVSLTSSDVVRQIANAHTIFNLLTAAILLPFTGYIIWLVIRMLPGEAEVEPFDRGPKYLDRRLLKNPSIAMAQVQKELERMALIAEELLDDSFQSFLRNDPRKIKEALEKEEILNELEREINNYLVNISQRNMSSQQSTRLTILYNVVNDIERVGDHAENIVELAEYRHDHGLPFSRQALEGLTAMHSRVAGAFSQAAEGLRSEEREVLEQVIEVEDSIDRMEEELRQAHISRLNEGRCYPGSGVVFLDIISNFERIGDHASSMAYWLLEGIK